MDETPETGLAAGRIRVGMRVPNADGNSVDEELEEVTELTDEEEQERVRELIEQTLEEEEAAHPAPKTPEEAEHQALEDVFADIRHESHYGRLVTREHWEAEGFVPEHLDADTFAELVFATLAGTGDESPAEREDKPAAETVAEATPAAAGAEPATAEAGTATVGTEPADAEAQQEAEEDAKPEEAPEKAEEPEKPQFAPLVFDDIVVMEGAKAKYLYSNREMTDAYAKWSFLAAEDDKVATFVSTVREESEIYPRPMLARSLTNDPFDLTPEEVAATWDIVRESGDYPDIETCAASNGDVYYYSTTFLEEAQAEALAEYYSVRRFMSP